jgi:4-amino-4-deoxy-L-arabinose transferase-like glycosyltransferase
MTVHTSIGDATQSGESCKGRFLLYLVFAVAISRMISLAFYPLMDTTEARYAEIARFMVETGDWVTPWFDPSVPFWGKPPLSFWMTAASFKIFGVNELAARLPHWLAGLAVLWLVWGIAIRHSKRLAIWTIALLVGAAMFFLSAGAVMTDMAMLVGTTMAMRGFWLGLHGSAIERRHECWWLFIGLGIGLLAKGPIAIVLSLVPIFFWTIVSSNISVVWRNLPWVKGSLLTLLIALPWYVLAEIRTPGFLDYFIVGEHFNRFLVPGWKGDLYGSAHQFPRGTIWFFLLVDLLPWVLVLPVLYIIQLFRAEKLQTVTNDRAWMSYLWMWGLTAAVFFTFAGNILWPYVLPGFPALALLTSIWLDRNPKPHIVDRFLSVGLVTTTVLFAVYIVGLKVTGFDKERSQKALIADYQSRRQFDEELIYVGARQFSADFYSKRQAIFVPDMSYLSNRTQYSSAYLAIPNNQVATMPISLKKSLQLISVHGRYTLYRADHEKK